MTDTQQPEKKVDAAAGDMCLINVAAQLIQGAEASNDPRVMKLAASVIDELKAGNILEMLLVAFAAQQQQPATIVPQASTIGVSAMAARNAQRPDYSAILEMIKNDE